MSIETVSKWAQEMEKDFQDLNHFPELEWLGAGCYVFYFYDLPKGQRLGIDNDSIVLYSSNPDCEGLWFHYFEENQTTKGKAQIACDIYDLIKLK